jgi:hypothetical protein
MLAEYNFQKLMLDRLIYFAFICLALKPMSTLRGHAVHCITCQAIGDGVWGKLNFSSGPFR